MTGANLLRTLDVGPVQPRLYRRAGVSSPTSRPSRGAAFFVARGPVTAPAAGRTAPGIGNLAVDPTLTVPASTAAHSGEPT